ncbi:MAG: cell division protein ZapE [Bacteroidota bacterium]
MPAPPPRFSEATFATYVAQNTSQEAATEAAQALVADIRARQGWWARFRARWAPPAWNGLYLVGPVGTGKTHLMVSMYHALVPEVPCTFLHSSELFRTSKTPEAFARDLAEEARVLCLDEVELDDPANEARLVHTLKSLAARGVTLVATSNVEPDKFLAAEFGNDRFRRFLSEEFRKTHKILVVRGEDYRARLEKPGRAWVGPADRTDALMRLHADDHPGRTRWLPFDELRARTIDTAHVELMEELLAYDALYLAQVDVTNTDDALRLLRVVDDVYTAPNAPQLYFTAPRPPRALFPQEDQHSGLAQGIAEKFIRTVSRLEALCAIEDLRHPSDIAQEAEATSGSSIS